MDVSLLHTSGVSPHQLPAGAGQSISGTAPATTWSRKSPQTASSHLTNQHCHTPILPHFHNRFLSRTSLFILLPSVLGIFGLRILHISDSLTRLPAGIRKRSRVVSGCAIDETALRQTSNLTNLRPYPPVQTPLTLHASLWQIRTSTERPRVHHQIILCRHLQHSNITMPVP